MALRSRSILAATSAVAVFFLTAVYLPAYEARAEEDHKQMVTKHIVDFLKARKVKASEETLRGMASTVYEESQLYKLDYRLVLAVMKVESNFRHNAVSPRGARGLLQIKPALAKFISKDAGVRYEGAKSLYEPDKNIRIGVYHLSNLIDDFKNVSHALHAYNAGVNRSKGKLSKNIEPTSRFVRMVLTEYDRNVKHLPEPNKLLVLPIDEVD